MADPSEASQRISEGWGRIRDAALRVGTEIETARVRVEHSKAARPTVDRHVKSAIELLTTRVRNAAVLGWDGGRLTVSAESEQQVSGVQKILPYLARAIYDVAGTVIEVDDIDVVIAGLHAWGAAAEVRVVEAVKVTAAAASDKELALRSEAVDRFPRDDKLAVDFYNYPVNLMFPWKVIREPKDANGDLLPKQNLWIGRNGSVIHVIYGGFDEKECPLGIPGHSLPLAIGIYLITEYKLKQDKGSTGKLITLGDSLAEFWRSLGFLGSIRGKRAKRALERICQYFECTHRIIEFPMNKAGEQAAYDTYLEFVASGCVPPGPIPVVPGKHKDGYDLDSNVAVVRDYNVWTTARPPRHGRQGGPMGYVTLSDEFVDRFAGEHAVPLPWEVVARLIKYPQALALATVILQTVGRLRDKGIPYVDIRVDNLQDMAGLNHDKSTIEPDGRGRRQWKRPGPTLRMIRDRILPALAWAAERRQVADWDRICGEGGASVKHPDYRMLPENGHSGKPTEIRFYPAPSLTDRRGGKRTRRQAV